MVEVVLSALLYRGNFANELQHFRMKKLILLILVGLCMYGADLLAQQTSLEQIRYHVYYLADDSLEGRLTGTDGEQKAAAYIQQQFSKLGLQAAGEGGTWLQPFTFTASQSLQTARLELDKKTLKNKQQFLVPTGSGSGKVSGNLVEVGYGIRNTHLKHDDYANKKGLEGAIFLIRLGSPDGNNPHGKFGADAQITTKLSLAKSLGAIGVVFYRNDSSTALPDQQFDRRTQSIDIPAVCLVAPLQNKWPKMASMEVEITKNTTTGHNVAGFIDHKQPYTLLIGAHYDHLGDGSLGGSLFPGKGAIHNGADDNASGTAALLMLADILRDTAYSHLNYLLIAFSGEELGLLGSAYFAKNPSHSLQNVTAMFNMDMVGRLDTATRQLGVYGTGTSPFWNEVVEAHKGNLSIKTAASGTGSSDHTSFYLQDMAVLHFFTGTHRDYHKPEDDADKINFAGINDVIDYMTRIIKAMPGDKKLAFTKTKDEDNRNTPRFKVTLGIMPDYFYEGKGVKVDGVTEGKPGSAAGLQAGDVLLELGDYQLVDMMAYMKALAAFEKGSSTQLVFERAGKKQTVEVTF
jgi:hypothetical protein